MVEMWERFSFYGVVALIVPYLTRWEVRRGRIAVNPVSQARTPMSKAGRAAQQPATSSSRSTTAWDCRKMSRVPSDWRHITIWPITTRIA